jgi:hypothetical protein
VPPSAAGQTVTPLRLAAPADGAASYDWEHIAYLLPGALPTLIDPGPDHLGDALLNALADSGFSPADIGQLLLTSHAAEMAGSAHRFPAATLFAAPAADNDRLLRAHRECARSLGEEVAHVTHATPSACAIWEHWQALHPVTPVTLANLRPLADGALLLAGDGTLVASRRPAFSDTGMVFASLDGGALFAGEFGLLDDDLPVGDWQAFADSLGAITQGALPEKLYPARGRIEATGQVAFRAMALSANNLISNLPLALARPATLQQLFERDLGYWPDAIAESALRLVRLRSALEELSRAGVVYRQAAPTMLQTGYAMIPT